MLNVTYIIFLYNQAEYLPELVASLARQPDNFRREYLIIDDCSTDDSVKVARQLFSTLPRVTIITKSIRQGLGHSLKNALSLVSYEYVHLIEADRIIAPDTTRILIGASKALGAGLAFGLAGIYDKTTNYTDNTYATGDAIIIEDPIRAALSDKTQGIADLCGSGTVMTIELLREIAGNNESIFLPHLALVLQAAQYTKFACVKETLYYKPKAATPIYSTEFVTYYRLLAIYDFMCNNGEIALNYIPEFYKTLWLSMKTNRLQMLKISKLFISRYITKKLTLSELKAFYKQQISLLEEKL